MTASNVRAAIIGYGASGRLLASNLIEATDGIDVAAIVARSPDMRALAAGDHPGARIYASVDDLLAEHDGVEVVVVGTPDSSHHAVALATLRAGLPTVVDKPLAQTSTQAIELCDVADAQGIMLTPFQNMRWSSDFLTVRRLLDSGELGAIVRMESRIARWSPSVGDTWREHPRQLGPDGPLADLGSHAVDQAVALFGHVSQVYAEVDRRRPATRVDDDLFLALTHESGVRTHVHLGYVSSSDQPRFVIQGLDGSYVKHGLDVQFSQLLAGEDPRQPGWGVEPESIWGTVHVNGQSARLASEPGNWTQFYTALVEALRDGASAPVDPRDAVHILEILEAALRSQESGSVIRLG